MQILLGRSWRQGFLDAHRPPGACRIRPVGVAVLAPVEGLYFVPERRSRLLFNYLREIGLTAVIRKIRSRLGERHRNRKYVIAGYGELLAGRTEGARAGDTVAFLGTCHPAASERVVVDGSLVWPLEPESRPAARPGRLPAVCWLPRSSETGPAVQGLAGWQAESGDPPPDPATARKITIEALRAAEWPAAPSAPPSPVALRRPARKPPGPASSLPTAVLFGYGNYAKTVILPNVSRHLRVTCIHEIDPLQIPRAGIPRSAWDTRPAPQPDDSFDVLLIAGYHHTHAELAVAALEAGAAAVVEKPVVVSEEQLDALLTALESSSGAVFPCFHKRYSVTNEWLRRDLELEPGSPVSYHCIVYEVPLPERHWYRWPNSRGRVISNGCHWIDHFLFLNQYSPPVERSVVRAADGTLNCTLSLANGAVFTMALTERGSSRIGLRELIELRTASRTVRMRDGTSYVAETGDRVLRRRRVDKLRSYAAMYRAISQGIRSGAPGDSPAALRASARAILDLSLLADAGHPGR